MQRHHELAASGTKMDKDGYTKFVGAIGERCAIALLKEKLPKSVAVFDANRTRMNQPGYDLELVGKQRVLVSVKALSHVEGFGWMQKNTAKSLNFDYLLHINFGCMLTPMGRCSKYGIPVKGEPEAYVVPKEVVQHLRARGSGSLGWIYCWNRTPGPCDAAKDAQELRVWKDRFDLLAAVM